ncbi:MAG: FtsQ-type POTRA domain-containing protein [Erysipelotrichaceae bacterium]
MIDEMQAIQESESEKNIVIEKRRKMREHYYFRKSKRTLFFLGIFLSFLIIGWQFFQSETSKIRKVNVYVDYLPSSYVLELSGLSEENVFLFVFDSLIEHQLEASPYIKSAEVTKGSYNIIQIEITEEKIVGYHMDDGFRLMLGSGEIIEASDDFVDLIRYVPLFVGFEDDEVLSKVANYFSEVDSKIIENISEIQRYPVSYDENQLQILMRDGHYFFTSYFSLEVLNYYYDILPTLDPTQSCIAVEEINMVPYTTACPWVVLEEDEEDVAIEDGADE